MHRVFLGLGANINDPGQQLRQAIRSLQQQPGIRVRAISSLYRTEPQGLATQPDFLNAVVELETEKSSQELLALGRKLEQAAGRRMTIKNGPRPLDIDILLVDQINLREPGLELPHPRMSERAFVLIPLLEIAPELEHPTLGVRIAELAQRLTSQRVARVALGPDWVESSEE